ncbi:MAG: FHA domain-containing protein, partial [Winkia neuii]|nr:FHA domain-containing protein [Winkia neuii]
MASELAVTVIRLGYLVLLWLFVAAALGVLRRDVWGTV